MAATRKSGVYLAIIGALVAVIVVMTYKLLLAGKTEAAPDGRVAILVEPPERASMTPGIHAQTQLVPYGLIGVISPWNFPFLLSMLDTIPALLAGCAVIVRSAGEELRSN